MPIQASNRPLPDWFTRIRTRQLVLPRFQRYEAWTHRDVVHLLNTILADLPIGSLLILQIGDESPFVWRALPGAPETGERINEHLLDGQQRLVALWRALNNNYPNQKYFLYYQRNGDNGDYYKVQMCTRWKKTGDTKLRPFWADIPDEQWKRGLIPLDLFFPEGDTQSNFRDWCDKALSHENQKSRDDVRDVFENVKAKFREFNLPFLSLDVNTPRETALDVFMKMNTSGASLSMYDIVVAQVEAGIGTSLHELVAGIREASPILESYYNIEELTLSGGALLQQRPPSKSTYLDPAFSRHLIDNWDRFVLGAKRTVAFLEAESVYDGARLPTEVVVPVLLALWADVPQGGDAEGWARDVLRRYLWRAFCTHRYESATSNRALSDYRELSAHLQGLDNKLPTVLDDEVTPLPEPEELVQAGWPKKKDRLARSILAVSLKAGGYDFADGSPASRENLARREYHHLFPASHFDETGNAYRALNCALVTWQTNRTIGSSSPEQYIEAREHFLTERHRDKGLSEEQIKYRLQSHVIPHQHLKDMNYSEFLSERAKEIRSHMARLCGAQE